MVQAGLSVERIRAEIDRKYGRSAAGAPRPPRPPARAGWPRRPPARGGDGEHGGAERLGGGGVVTVGGWQIELLSHPAPLARGQRSHVVAKVLTAVAQAPASGGEAAIGLAPPRPAPA